MVGLVLLQLALRRCRGSLCMQKGECAWLRRCVEKIIITGGAQVWMRLGSANCVQ